MPPDDRGSNLIAICSAATGLTQSEVLSIAGTAPQRYKIYQIDKKRGGKRTICHPSRELKALQYVFLNEILKQSPVHPNATAYKKGSSIRINAETHKNSRVILKLDFTNFFNSIKVDDWARYARSTFSNWSRIDLGFSNYVLFWGQGGYTPVCLAIGAPTSPLLSNMLMYRFDEIMSEYATDNRIVYTRYADDITFSSEQFLDRQAVVQRIAAALREIRSPRLTLNPEKTRLASKSTMRQVTGLILANDGRVSLGRAKKRLLRSMVHRAINGRLGTESLTQLKGFLAFSQDVEPTFLATLTRKYGAAQLDAVRGIVRP